MRPRITRQEAAYIVDVLQSNKTELEAKQAELEQLEKEVWQLKRDLLKGRNLEYLDAKPKRERLEQLKKQAYSIYVYINKHERLIKKYSAIANGETRRGEYKHNYSINDFWQQVPFTVTEIIQKNPEKTPENPKKIILIQENK